MRFWPERLRLSAYVRDLQAEVEKSKYLASFCEWVSEFCEVVTANSGVAEAT